MKSALIVVAAMAVGASVLVGCSGDADAPESSDSSPSLEAAPSLAQDACESWSELLALEEQLTAGDITAPKFIIRRLDLGEEVKGRFAAAAAEDDSFAAAQEAVGVYLVGMPTTRPDDEAASAETVDAACAG